MALLPARLERIAADSDGIVALLEETYRLIKQPIPDAERGHFNFGLTHQKE